LTLPDDQAAELVTSALVPSAKVAVAVKGWVVPVGIEAMAGLTLRAVTIDRVTVTADMPVTAPNLAVTMAVPAASEVAKPVAEIAPLVTVAVLGSLDVHMACDVTSCLLPSE